ncbi:MAG: hypothetical protein ACRESY_08620 [Steroidobacteraceae bacterium]
MKLRDYAVIVSLGGLSMLPSVHAADSTVDEGLLEFLGSVDTEDKNWHQYLADTDIDKVARRAAHPRGDSSVNPPPSTPPANSAAPSSPPAGSPPPSSPAAPTEPPPAPHS